ncbi:MAG: nitroreductase family protein, partial [Bacteroidaceae bacterium]|nr:nitroreductase family protein [Bacteroidaceae bacterium]
MKTFLELAQARQSDRAYEPGRVIEREVLDRILEAGRLAPSACNGQPWHFTVVTETSLLHEVAKSTSSLGLNRFVKDSAALVLIT